MNLSTRHSTAILAAVIVLCAGCGTDPEKRTPAPSPAPPRIADVRECIDKSFPSAKLSFDSPAPRNTNEGRVIDGLTRLYDLQLDRRSILHVWYFESEPHAAKAQDELQRVNDQAVAMANRKVERAGRAVWNAAWAVTTADRKSIAQCMDAGG